MHCKKVYVYALTATDYRCGSISTLYSFPEHHSCSAVSSPHCTRTDSASDPRCALYTVTFLRASVGAGRRKRTTRESNCSQHRYHQHWHWYTSSTLHEDRHCIPLVQPSDSSDARLGSPSCNQECAYVVQDDWLELVGKVAILLCLLRLSMCCSPTP